ncbi:beta-glucosidase [Planosporangium thailandense]|uniref:beta-glucosidase n=1 Tax=Planosporangium thailandense TaxID=765197 RepID=A0ABX0Y1J4_9ACTN|nr:glycoside hydrolase family 3 N-terminal domain-containing protein [Planosporangium thailandense]NJC72231.1 beta-glucosidase [Planosporangium thailandense]
MSVFNHRAVAAAATAVLLLAPGGGAAVAAARPRYLDPTAAPQARAADLVRRMTLDEKVGQLVQIEVGHVLRECPNGIDDGCARPIVGTYGVGSILSGAGSAPFGSGQANTPRHWAEQINALVHASINDTRLHIPIMYGADVVHGHGNVLGDTLFPHNLGLGASYDPALVRDLQRAAAADAVATNVRWAFAPDVDLAVDTIWGRYYESFGEDPTLVATLGAASVRGLESNPLLASSVKHFIGSGRSGPGLDRADADVSWRALADRLIPAYRAAIAAGADTVMAYDGTVDSVPVTGSRYLLTDVLRGQLRFSGVVISDYGAVRGLLNNFHMAADYEHAAAIAINAGIDMTMEPDDAAAFTGAVKAAVAHRLIPMTRIDQAVARILTLKFANGIFDRPYVDAAQADRTLGAHAELARRAAAESTVVLRNAGSLLPLAGDARLTVTGPGADSVRDTLGGWSIGWQGVPADSAVRAVTVRAGLANADPHVRYAPGQDEAVAAAGDTDAYVAVVGDPPGAEGPNDSRDPTLPADQQALVRALLATGKPVVLVVLDDRPLALGSLVDPTTGAVGPQAVVMAWRPGTEGGNGVADVLFGAVNPSARLPVSWPLRGADHRSGYLDLTLPTTSGTPGGTYQPLFPFGAGLSYTDYTIGPVAAAATPGGVTVTVPVANTGTRAGDLVVPVYVSQPVSAVAVPRKRLVGFTRTTLAAGESRRVSIAVPWSRLAVVTGDVDGDRHAGVEPGAYVFASGPLTAEPPPVGGPGTVRR